MPLRGQQQFAHPWVIVLQPLKKNQIICVNKCNKASISITKDIDRKFIPFYEMCEASDGLKYLYKIRVLGH
jgi:hypothetical protein